MKVEWMKLGEFAKCEKAKNKKREEICPYSITQRGLVPTEEFFKQTTRVTSKDTSSYYIVHKNWFVYSPSRIDVGSINFLRVEGPVIVSPIDVVFSIDETQCHPAYLLSYLLSYEGMKQILSYREGVEGMGRRTLPFMDMAKVRIPLPLLDTQLKIVNQLDTFTSLIASLESELDLRRKQYEHYRNRLLDFEEVEDVEWKKLGEFAKCEKARNKKQEEICPYSITQKGLVPTEEFFKQTTRVTSKDTSSYYIVHKNWFVYSPSRIDVGSINYLRVEGPVIVSPIDVVFSIDETQCHPTYLLSYLLSNEGMNQVLSYREGVEGMGRRTLPFIDMAKVRIPLPLLDTQQSIVEKLDAFEQLVAKLEEEIALRKKQYEYYREKLLTFE